MKIIISGKHMTIQEDVREYAIKKFSKLEKFFNREAEAHLTFGERRKGNYIVLDATIYYRNIIFRAEVENHDSYAIIDKGVERIERQIIKNKTKLEKRFHVGAFKETDDLNVEQTIHKIVKLKKFSIKPMSVEEAVLQMDLLGHEFFIFLNADSEDTNVVYKRKDGNYGLIEPEA
ncbi:MAG: ribosome-associated translation inhibitor RaiA [Clostridiales bacterium]|nr:ribosome-associated translation inhibitor RaiA [Clostridiales bacterium]